MARVNKRNNDNNDNNDNDTLMAIEVDFGEDTIMMKE